MRRNPAKTLRPFTGHHMAMVLVTFFAIVIGVNIIMARYAIMTFGGTVVDNSYVASQKFNRWLSEARREQALGWSVSDPVRADGGEVLLHVHNAYKAPLAGAAIMARAEHPLGREGTRELRFMETAPGSYSSTQALPAGRWKLRIRIVYAREELDLASEVH
ncbi:MAG: FixH family protein [Sphingobium sp.]|nr:FixH family protein [Sphingobium sp.]MBP6111576.1 FixH family protein [Sphingobium sp.]MBP8670975.1 FixH family protein [Sphingobium sp.]MBP9158058.1 FixH family protein [Sphingobium sp.]MCC6481885.1 FixH family protein [Sphingomonadaceae bacterium]